MASFLKDLEKDGYAVIPNILTNEECDSAIDGIWDWLALLSNGEIDRQDSDTWLTNWPYTFGKKGIIQWYGVGQSQFVWDVRQNPKVIDIFKKIWKTDDLLVSFDGINIQIPPEMLRSGFSPPFSEGWHHMDQGKKKIGRFCIQGFVNLEETDEDDGCLVVRPGTHLLHQSFISEFGEEFAGGDWLKLEEHHRQWYDEGSYHPIRVQAPKGSVVLWDSRTVHANSTAQKGRADPERFRYVIYTCYLPRKDATEAQLKKKRKYFEEGRMTNHWPYGFKVFPMVPRLFGEKRYDEGFALTKGEFMLPNLSEVGRRLAGFD